MIASDDDNPGNRSGMPTRHLERDGRPPGMADNHVALDAEFRGRGMDEIGLGAGGPRSAAGGAWAQAETRSVEGKHAISGGGFVEDSACREVFRRSTIAVQEQQRSPTARFQKMQLRSAEVDEAPERACSQCPPREAIIVERQPDRCGRKQQKQVPPGLCCHD